MSASTIEFDSAFTSDLIDAASVSFVRGYLFRRYGRWLIAACLINAVGFGLVLWLGGNDGLVLAFITMIVVVGPAYLALFYFSYPRRFAERMKQRLMPRALAQASILAVPYSNRSWARRSVLLEVRA
jgi:hypothetical protein